MDIVSLRAYRIADKMDLSMLARLFYKKQGRLARLLHVRGDAGMQIPGFEDISQGVYLFSNGCAVFYGMGASGTREFLEFLHLQGVDVDWDAFARFVEEMEVQICPGDDTVISVERGRAVISQADTGCIEALATALARSVRLETGLERAEAMYGKSELLLDAMRRQKGALSKDHMRGLADFLMMLMESEFVAPPAGTPAFLRRRGAGEELYVSAARLYRLEDRYQAIRERNIHLRKTLKQYATLIHRREEIKAYIIEIILLGSFLVMDYFYYF